MVRQHNPSNPGNAAAASGSSHHAGHAADPGGDQTAGLRCRYGRLLGSVDLSAVTRGFSWMVTRRRGGSTTSCPVVDLDIAEPTADASERRECLAASFGLVCISSAAASSAADAGLSRTSPALLDVSQSGSSPSAPAAAATLRRYDVVDEMTLARSIASSSSGSFQLCRNFVRSSSDGVVVVSAKLT